MFHDVDRGPFRKFKDYATGSTYTLDLVVRGGMGSPARQLEVIPTGTGTLWVRHKADWSAEQIEVTNGQKLSGYFAEIAFGNLATYNPGAGGSWPATLTGAETIELAFDTGTDHASGTMTLTFAAGSYTQAQLLASINSQLNTLLPPPGGHSAVAYAVDVGSGDSSLRSRSRGSAAEVDITVIHATLATALAWGVSTTPGTAFAAPATQIRVGW